MLGFPNSKDKTMKTLAERLKHAMEILPSKKIKGVDLARAVGVKPPSVSDWLSGKSKTMEGENLLKASKFLGVNANWLATGAGSPNEKNTKEDDLSNILYRELGIYKIPTLDYIQVGRYGDNDSSFNCTYVYTDYQCSKPEAVISLIVEGNSMEPDFTEGDILIIDTKLKPKPGSYVIAQSGNNEIVFKKYKVLSQDKYNQDIFELISLNSDYPTLKSEVHQIKVIGVVVKHIRNFK